MSVAAGVCLVVALGALIAPQAPLNRRVAGASGPLGAAALNFYVALLCGTLACLLAGKLSGVWGIWDEPPELALGGVLGAIFVLCAVLSVGSIGASGVTAGTVAGQLVASLALDATGAVGLEQRSLDAVVLIGAGAVLLGTYLVVARDDSISPGGGAAPGRRLLPIAVVFLGGLALGVQHPLNGYLGSHIGDLPAAEVNFLVGSLALSAVVLARGEAARLGGWVRVPWGYRLGGVIGAIAAIVSLSLVETIGAGALAAATVTGLALASLALDRAGVLGLPRRPLSELRLLGALLVIAGTVLVAVE